MTTLYDFEIGATLVSALNLEELTVPVTHPKPTYSPYSDIIELGDGSMRGVGSPEATWHWDFLPRVMRDQLRTFCTGASSNVVIRTYVKDNAGALKYFECVMTWPTQSEETQTAKAIDFTLKFTQLVDVTP